MRTMKSFSYECYICSQLVDRSFFLCCNCHVSCDQCQRVERLSSGVDECPMCGVINVQCMSYSVFEENREIRCESPIGQPTLILPLPQLTVSSNLNDASSRNSVIKCPDCRKYVLLTHAMEHYKSDHKSIVITPIFPGAIVSFRLSPQILHEGALKRLQLLLMIDVADESDSSNDSGNEPSFGGEKLFFLTGTKFESKGSRNTNLIALWLSASFQVTSTVFSLEITSHFNTTISTTVSGTPMDLTSCDLFNRKKPCVAINDETMIVTKESTIETLEKHGGCIINISIQDSSRQ